MVARYFHHIVFGRGKGTAYRLAAKDFDSEESPLSPRTVARWVKVFERWGSSGLKEPSTYEQTGRRINKERRLKAAGWSQKEINLKMRNSSKRRSV